MDRVGEHSKFTNRSINDVKVIRRTDNSKINDREVFNAVSEDYSFTIKIDTYVPYVCGAVHDGHQFRKELWSNCIHTEYERWFEEDQQQRK